MDWTKQTEDMLNTWMGTQKRMWDNWLDTVQKSAPQFHASELWEKTLETWEETVKKSLEGQSEWIKMWAENMPPVKGLPKEVAEWAQHSQELNQNWVDLQEQLWAVWFGLIKKSEPGKIIGSWDQESQRMAQMWQESVGKFMEAQMEFARTWGGETKKDEKREGMHEQATEKGGNEYGRQSADFETR
ncbi:MAG TPA: hypothetical protein VEQ38_02935 [Verrucomicrobiae bacterium]|jgi:hypothetical protein|nr:hypothetical protein [Verrucomicrobiae bacterium]